MELLIKSARGTEVYYKDTSLEFTSPILNTSKYAGELKTGDQLICQASCVRLLITKKALNCVDCIGYSAIIESVELRRDFKRSKQGIVKVPFIDGLGAVFLITIDCPWFAGLTPRLSIKGI